MGLAGSRKKDRLVSLVVAGVLVGVLLFCAGLITRTHREFRTFKMREARVESELRQARKEFARKEAYLVKLMNDPEFLERVVRERLGYAAPNELLFRFSEEPPEER